MTSKTLACSAKDVAVFLEKNPEFFQEHPSLLLNLTLPHPSGSAISLIERQVALLRDENKKLRLRTKELVEIARENEELVDKLHSLNMDLFSTSTLAGFSTILVNKLKADFHSSHVSIKFFKEAVTESGSNDKVDENVVSRAEKSIASFEKFLHQKTPVCGRFSSQQLAFLFGDKALEVKSLALIPLVSDGTAIGMFAIGSTDVEHFKAGMSTSLLSSLADVASAVAKRIVS